MRRVGARGQGLQGRPPTETDEGGYRRLVESCPEERSGGGRIATRRRTRAGPARSSADRNRRRRVSPTRRKLPGGAKRRRTYCDASAHAGRACKVVRRPKPTKAGIADSSKVARRSEAEEGGLRRVSARGQGLQGRPPTAPAEGGYRRLVGSCPEERSGGGRLATRQRTRAGPARSSADRTRRRRVGMKPQPKQGRRTSRQLVDYGKSTARDAGHCAPIGRLRQVDCAYTRLKPTRWALRSRCATSIPEWLRKKARHPLSVTGLRWRRWTATRRPA